MKIWIVSILVTIGGIVVLSFLAVLSAMLEDYMVSRFGKPPTWVCIFNAVMFLALITIAVKRSIQ